MVRIIHIERVIFVKTTVDPFVFNLKKKEQATFNLNRIKTEKSVHTKPVTYFIYLQNNARCIR